MKHRWEAGAPARGSSYPDVSRETPLTAEAFASLARVDEETLARLRLYLALLEKWQRRINLVAASTLTDPWRRHMLDSAQLLPLLPAGSAGVRIADLGSGAGFPGLVLALMGGGEVTLIESDSRKSAFLREMIRATGAPARVETARIEALAPLAADVVTARACAPLRDLLGYVARHLSPAGSALLLKGRGAVAELTQAGKLWMMSVDLMPSQSHPDGHVIKLTTIRPR
ncbi:MAG: 16S rRNA (guanine(527)-N(7))-methyltransferase RsmG [Rhodospirillales bacterium]|nr:16S rRNA (guanine(527)-N(7))-methyltransferase RsmG [Rhodospirillales bacterium]